MKRSSTPIFATFMIISLSFLLALNFYESKTYFTKIDHNTVLWISASIIFLIIISFVYREVENNKIQNEFITVVTHKFRTPLTGIRWTINMLQKDLTLLEKKDLLTEMQKANERLMEIVDLLVGFARFDKRLEYAFEAVSLSEIVSVSVNKYSAMIKNKEIKFQMNSDTGLPLVIIDKAKMQFVVDMLIDNAIKYTPKGGMVSALYEMDEKSITLKITDTGIGFGFFDSKRIFKNFFRAKSAKLMDTEGLGLGLYTAKKIVVNHHGKLWATSPGVNQGATFAVRLPIKR